jgi:APA family basic amino acid/polyamine antiporter
MSEQPDQRPKLERVLGLREGISIHMGVIIGSGIFIVPATIAGHLGAMGPIMIVWVLAGMLTLFGALTLAELSSVLPQSGGPYVYLRESFGRVWGFLFSWNDFFINKAGSAAAIAVAFATYLGTFVPALDPRIRFFHTELDLLGVPFDIGFGPVQLAAIGVIALVTWVNVRGVKFGAWVMNIFTSAKVLALVGLIIAAIFYSQGSTDHYVPWWPAVWDSSYTAAFGLAMISALWAYDGWVDVTITAGEFKDPSRTIPRSLLFGTLAVITLYVTAIAVLGPIGASLIIIGIMASTFGTTNGMLLVGPRSIHAAGTDGVMPKRLGTIHPRYHTPATAILTLGIWSAILTLSGTYEQITSYVVFGSWALYALTAASVIVLRRKMPDAPRPYKAWGYPYATLVFVALAGWFVYNTLVEDTRNAVIGIILLLVSLPIYYRMTAKKREETSGAS